MAAPRALFTLAWAASRAASSLAVASAAWMLSGLTPSPLINGLLPAVVSAPLLLPLPSRPRLGTLLQVLAAVVLLAIAARLIPLAVLATFLAVLLLSAGAQLVDLPVQRLLRAAAGIPMAALRTGAEAGRLVGNSLAGVLFPLGKALLQFSQVLVLLLPLVALVAWLPPSADEPASTPAAPARLEPAPLLQGMLFGALFGLIPLWVRQEGAGNCFDFAMVLTAYGLGRAAAEALQARLRLGAASGYLLLALGLAATQWLPGWGAVLLFVPLGLLASCSDQRLIQALGPADDPALRAQRFNRSACLGGLAGSVAMGLAGQTLGLAGVLPLQLLAFGLAAVLIPRLLPVPR
ncbi:MAG: hypothetical protein ACKO5M_01575 [Vulcanococcus sp.]